MSRSPLQQKLISIVEPALVAAGFELVDLRFLLEQGGWILRIQIGMPLDLSLTPEQRAEVADDQVDLSDCENMSRELSAVIDVDDPIPQAYSLEVSSPGIDRPLRTPAHFQYYAGSEAKLALYTPLQTPTGERRNFRGILKGATATHVTIECDGQPFELAIADLDSAKLVPDWDAVMKGKSGVGSKPPKPVKPGHRPSKKHRAGNDQKMQKDQG
jgi:ribosome maturation factor RimP